MGFELFKKDTSKEVDNTALFSSQISDISRRLMLIESRVKTISDKQDELGRTLFERTNSLEKQIAAMGEQLKSDRLKVNLLEQKQSYLEKYLHILVPKTDMMVLRAKVNLLNPLYLMSKEEVAIAIDEKIAEFKKKQEGSKEKMQRDTE